MRWLAMDLSQFQTIWLSVNRELVNRKQLIGSATLARTGIRKNVDVIVFDCLTTARFG